MASKDVEKEIISCPGPGSLGYNTSSLNNPSIQRYHNEKSRNILDENYERNSVVSMSSCGIFQHRCNHEPNHNLSKLSKQIKIRNSEPYTMLVCRTVNDES